MKFILGKKLEMTQKYADNGEAVPVTKVQAGPCRITQIKQGGKDGYFAFQLGFGKKRKIAKPLRGHLKNFDFFSVLKECRVSNSGENKNLKVGDKIDVSAFSKGDIVKVSGVSKGKGFQGVVKRWGFHGSPASHGHKDQLRMPGSIGATGAQHVFKGVKMGGRTGGNNVTVSNLEIVDIDKENNFLYIKGALPGSRNSIVMISGEGEIEILPTDQSTDKDGKPETKNSEVLPIKEQKDGEIAAATDQSREADELKTAN